MSGSGELRTLTSVRGIAAWAVVLYHIRLAPAGLPDGAIAVLAKGYLAVDFFFLLSGFVIWLTWHERLRDAGWRAVPDFLQKRVARIWPLHLAMLALAAALALALWLTGRSDPQFPLSALPAHILLIQAWGLGDITLKWNDPAWSISAEFAAYLLFPILAMRIDWRRASTVAIITILVVLAAALFAILRWHGVTLLSQDIEHFAVLRCLVEFTSGTAIAALWMRWRDAPRAPMLASAAIGYALVVASLLGIVAESFAVPLGFGALLLALALSERPGHPLGGRVLHYLGTISFATYLSHMLLRKIFKLALVSDPYAVSPGLVVLYLAIVLVASVVLYHGIERPAQRWVNRWPLRRLALKRLPSPTPR